MYSENLAAKFFFLFVKQSFLITLFPPFEYSYSIEIYIAKFWLCFFFFFFYPRKVGEGKKVEYSLNWHYANLWGVRQNENLFINNYSHLFIYKMEYGFDERKERKYIICISPEIERIYEKEKLTRLEKIWIIYAYEYWFLVHSIFSSPFSYFAICTNWINPYFADGGHFKRTFLFISICAVECQ